jgi:hypothetical protein
MKAKILFKYLSYYLVAFITCFLLISSFPIFAATFEKEEYLERISQMKMILINRLDDKDRKQFILDWDNIVVSLEDTIDGLERVKPFYENSPGALYSFKFLAEFGDAQLRLYTDFVNKLGHYVYKKELSAQISEQIQEIDKIIEKVKNLKANPLLVDQIRKYYNIKSKLLTEYTEQSDRYNFSTPTSA